MKKTIIIIMILSLSVYLLSIIVLLNRNQIARMQDRITSLDESLSIHNDSSLVWTKQNKNPCNGKATLVAGNLRGYAFRCLSEK